MKPINFWEIEDVFILTGIMILIIGVVAGLIFVWLQEKEDAINKTAAAIAAVFGLLAAGMLYLYITTCGWQPRELCYLIGAMFAAFACGLFFAELINP